MRRLGALSRHVVAAQGHEPHFIGEDSALALMLSPKNGERSAHSRLNRLRVCTARLEGPTRRSRSSVCAQ